MYASINMSGFKSKYNETMPNSLEASSPKEHVIHAEHKTCLDSTILEVTWSRQVIDQYKKIEGWLVQIKHTHACIHRSTCPDSNRSTTKQCPIHLRLLHQKNMSYTEHKACLDSTILEVTWSRQVTTWYKKIEGWLL
jgi:hypothetical protein